MQKKPIPHSRPTLGTKEASAVSAVIESGHIAEGEVVQKFEETLANFLDLNFAVSTSSGRHLSPPCLGELTILGDIGYNRGEFLASMQAQKEVGQRWTI